MMSNPQSKIQNLKSKIVLRRTLALGPLRVRLDPALWLPWLAGAGLMAAILGAVVVLGGLGKRENSLTGHSGPVTSVAYSPDGALLASASEDTTIRLWNPARGELIRTLTGHGGPRKS